MQNYPRIFAFIAQRRRVMVKKNSNLAEYLFHEGTNFRAFDYMGAHRVGSSFVFRTWAPNADVVYLCGDFNNWDKSLPMKRTTKGGIWEVILPSSVSFGENSKYKFITERDGSSYYKADPYAFFFRNAKPHRLNILRHRGLQMA